MPKEYRKSKCRMERPLLRGPRDGRHSVAAPPALECGGKRSATPPWLARRKVPAQSKRRRRCALSGKQNRRLGRGLADKHSKGPACFLASRLLCKSAALVWILWIGVSFVIRHSSFGFPAPYVVCGIFS